MQPYQPEMIILQHRKPINMPQVKPIYTCTNESQVTPGDYRGQWMGDEIDFIIGGQPVKIKTHGTGQAAPIPVVILIFPDKVLVWEKP